MHPCLGNWVAIGRAFVYYAQAARTLSVGINCLHCSWVIFWQLLNEGYYNRALSDIQGISAKNKCLYYIYDLEKYLFTNPQKSRPFRFCVSVIFACYKRIRG